MKAPTVYRLSLVEAVFLLVNWYTPHLHLSDQCIGSQCWFNSKIYNRQLQHLSTVQDRLANGTVWKARLLVQTRSVPPCSSFHSILTKASCCFVSAQKASSVSASLPPRALVKMGVLFLHKRNNDAPKNKTVLTNGSQGPVTVRGAVPGCNYRDNSCLIIQWGEEPCSPLERVCVCGTKRKP